MNPLSWVVWAAILFLQNISFTYVSRARSSGSIVRHAKASVFSNGIWIFSQMIMLGPLFDYLTGKHGREMQLAAASLYTVSCVGGSLFAHWLAMKTEKCKDAVGFNKKYAQIPVEQWAEIQLRLLALEDITEKQEAEKVPGDNMTTGTFRVEQRKELSDEWVRAFGGNFTSEGLAKNCIDMRGRKDYFYRILPN